LSTRTSGYAHRDKRPVDRLRRLSGISAGTYLADVTCHSRNTRKPRQSYGQASSNTHTPLSANQNPLPPYARPSEPPAELRPLNPPAPPSSVHYPRTSYDQHQSSVPSIGSGHLPQTGAQAGAEAAAREREERPSSTAPPKRYREWDEDNNMAPKKASTDESR
jgi:general transcriptional corepressor CYC8